VAVSGERLDPYTKRAAFDDLPLLPSSRGAIYGFAACLGVCVGVLAAVRPALATVVACAAVFLPLLLMDLARAVAVYLFVLFFKDLDIVSVGPTALGVLTFMVFVGVRTRDQRMGLALRGSRTPLTVLALLIAWAALSMLWSRDSGLALEDKPASLLQWLTVLLLVPIAVSCGSTRRSAQTVVLAFVFGAAATVVVGFAGVGDAWVDGRLSAGVGDPNHLAALLIAALALGFGGLRLVRRPALRLTLVGAEVVILIGLGATQSRGGLVGLGVMLLVALWIYERRRAQILAATLALLCATGAFLIASPIASERLAQAEGGAGRSDIWTVAWRVSADHPIAGVGLNNFVVVSKDYLRTPGPFEFGYLISRGAVVHNMYLQTLVELGIIGLGALLSVFVLSLKAMIRASRRLVRAGDEDGSFLLQTIATAICGTLAASLFISNAIDPRLWMLIGVGLGFAATATAAPAQSEPDPAVVR